MRVTLTSRPAVIRSCGLILLLSGGLLARVLGGTPGETEIGKTPTVKFLKEKRCIEVDGEVCLDSGFIELVVCAKGGKEYESILAVDCKPYEIHLCLLMLGLVDGPGPKFQGDATRPRGDLVDLFVEWQEGGQAKRVRAEDLVYNVKAKRPMKHTPWVFVGSELVKEEETDKQIYMANVEGSIATTYHDPYTVFDNPLPDGVDDTAYEVNGKVVPQKGTKVKLIIVARPKPAEEGGRSGRPAPKPKKQ